MSRLLLIGLLTTALFGAVARDAPAQRDAGAKARGDMRGFWDPSYRGSRGPSFYYQQAPAVESYRSFSYEPIAIASGDEVTINVKEAKLMLGRTVVGTLEDGQKFEVTRVINGWLGAVVEQDGLTLKGWVWHRNVSPEAVAVGQPPRSAAPTPTYRRFSYEPAQPSPSYRTYERRKESWQYPKTDARRYQH